MLLLQLFYFNGRATVHLLLLLVPVFCAWVAPQPKLNNGLRCSHASVKPKNIATGRLSPLPKKAITPARPPQPECNRFYRSTAVETSPSLVKSAYTSARCSENATADLRSVYTLVIRIRTEFPRKRYTGSS